MGSNPTLSEGINRVQSVKEIINHLSREQERYGAALSYVPFVGWLFPLYLKRESSLCQSHAKQGFILAIFFTALAIFFTLFETFVPNEWRVLRLALIVIVYVLYGVYFSLCAVGIYMSSREQEFLFPVVGRYARQLKL